MRYTIRMRETGYAAQSPVPLELCLASLEAAAEFARAAAFRKLYQSFVKLPLFPRVLFPIGLTEILHKENIRRL